MFVNLTYGECLQVSSALNVVSSVYGNTEADKLKRKFDDVMEYMDNAPITEVYPAFTAGVGTVST